MSDKPLPENAQKTMDFLAKGAELEIGQCPLCRGYGFAIEESGRTRHRCHDCNVQWYGPPLYRTIEHPAAKKEVST